MLKKKIKKINNNIFMKNFLNDENFFKKDTFAVSTLRYEQLKGLEAGKAVIKDAVNRWEQIGFLEGIENEAKKEVLAVTLDNIAHDLVTENERMIKIKKKYDFNCAQDDDTKLSIPFDVMVFPLARRVICKTHNFNYDEFLTYLEKYSFLAINYDGYDYDFKCDIEAEFCALLSLIIENLFNNKEK